MNHKTKIDMEKTGDDQSLDILQCSEITAAVVVLLNSHRNKKQHKLTSDARKKRKSMKPQN
ncbi:CLUMA_CG003739, isoform A [Clunio marinus]|uniref:CLUMA_CG003739, isoform A n=1 Tax=Clunio marinus TaxID=568069 RepID=A0A1J1HRJ2_9DIPT|nr:CLUMA_CG003739, isoform A [Clunio marinus]